MWSRPSSDTVPAAWPREAPAALALGALLFLALQGCGSTPSRSKPVVAAAQRSAAAKAPGSAATGAASGGAASKETAATIAGSAAAAQNAAVHPEVSPAARADFDRAVQYMRSGNAVEAE